MFWFALFSGATIAVYLAVIRPQLAQFRATAGILAAIDAAGLARWQAIRLRLLGLKTWFFGCLGILVTVLPAALESLHLVDWTTFFTPEVALKISGVIMLLMTVTHILGMVTAAKIEPKTSE